jgi:FKBP-type peptidyl-prolyl cis-trans isomerase
MRSRLLALVALLAVASCEPTAPPGPSNPATDTYAASLGVDIASMVKVSPDLYYKDIVVGTGSPEAARNKTITVYYTGYTTDGQSFDSNVGDDALRETLSDVNFIAGWVVGIAGMKPGGTRKIVIGSQLGYGPQGNGPIPPNATLVFDIQLVKVE